MNRPWGAIPSSDATPRRGATFGCSLLVVAAYVGAGRLGLAVTSAQHPAAVVWPAAGIALAAILIGGLRLVPAVALGALITALSTGELFGGALLATAGDTVEPLLAVALLRRTGFDPALQRTGDVLGLVLVAAVAAAAGALLGVLGLLAAGSIGGGGLWTALRDWWLGDLSGVLIAGAALLVVAGSAPLRRPFRAALELGVLATVTGVASYVLLRGHGSVPYLVLPLVFVLAFAYRQRGATLGGVIVSAVVVVITARGHGPFPGGALTEELLRAQVFASVGTVTGLLVAAAQSERQLAEGALTQLADSESALGEAQSLARIGSSDADLRTGRVSWSRELYRILGRLPAELEPSWEAWRAAVHPDDVALFDAALGAARGEEGTSAAVHRIVRPDGSVRTVEGRFRIERDVAGEQVRLHGTIQDVTKIRLAEDRFRALFEHAPYAILVIDEGGRVSLANLQARQMFAAPEEDLAGRQVEDLVPTPAGSSRPWFREPPASGLADLELVAYRAGGGEFPVEVSLTPMASEEGTLVSATIRDVTELRLAEETLTHQARHDALTGLPNRVLFLERLEQALARARRSRRGLAVLFLDLDDFKLVNDTLGHDAGDVLLRQLTPRLHGAVRHGDTIARLGGDEFVVLYEDLSHEADVHELAVRIIDAMRRPVMLEGAEQTVSVSAGVVMVTDADADAATAGGVLRDADAAMYSAKEGGKGRFAVFDQTMREELLERLAIEGSLRAALARGELRVYYQPVMALTPSRVVAAEALLRWQHPVRGLLEPAEFIPVAERTALIGEIGEWVVGQACRQAVRWRDLAGDLSGPDGLGGLSELGGLRPAIPVSVNIAAGQLRRPGLAAAVARILGETGLEPQLLELEVTESTLLLDEPAARVELRALKALGVKLIVDNFGTGYSSLQALRELAVDGLKLDRSFVAALGGDGGDRDGDGALVAAVLSLAGALDAEVTAEGVETWAQVARLRGVGCDYAQGFLFARPGPAERVTALLSSSVPVLTR